MVRRNGMWQVPPPAPTIENFQDCVRACAKIARDFNYGNQKRAGIALSEGELLLRETAVAKTLPAIQSYLKLHAPSALQLAQLDNSADYNANYGIQDSRYAKVVLELARANVVVGQGDVFNALSRFQAEEKGRKRDRSISSASTDTNLSEVSTSTLGSPIGKRPRTGSFQFAAEQALLDQQSQIEEEARRAEMVLTGFNPF